MPRTILGVVLARGELTAVHLRGGWKGATVTRVEHITTPSGSTEELGAAVLTADLPRADALIAGLPSDQAFSRIVELPFSDRAKVVRAAPLEAEETLPLPLEQLVYDVQVLGKSPGGTQAFLAAAGAQAVTELIGDLETCGLRPQGIDVAALGMSAVVRHAAPAEPWVAALDLGSDLHQALLLGPGGPRAFHALSGASSSAELLGELGGVLGAWCERFTPPAVLYLSGAAALEQDLDAWNQRLGLPVQLLPLPANVVTASAGSDLPWPTWAIPLGLALKEGYAKGASTINLLQGSFAPARESGPWRRKAATAAVYLTLLGGLWAAAMWNRVAQKETQYETLKTAIRTTFQQVLPGVRAQLELDQMRNQVRELEERAESLGSLVDREVSPLSMLREISARIPEELEVEFRDFTVEEGRVRIEGSTTSFDAIDKIKADLIQYPRFATVVVSDAKAGVERDKVLFKLTITLGREG
ncbi:MAG: GspL/Epsl periplasmic domain-containing protein [Deferrisomatales bacterium]|nr:GspL/Epsl periplasmic domain-containing protein [Deferrisomatales bacterium]